MNYTELKKLAKHVEKNMCDTSLEREVVKWFKFDNRLSNKEAKQLLHSKKYLSYKRDYIVDLSRYELGIKNL